MSLTNFITSTDLCRDQLMPRGHAERAGESGKPRRSLAGVWAPAQTASGGADIHQEWIEPARGVPREGEATGQPLFKALREQRSQV